MVALAIQIKSYLTILDNPDQSRIIDYKDTNVFPRTLPSLIRSCLISVERIRSYRCPAAHVLFQEYLDGSCESVVSGSGRNLSRETGIYTVYTYHQVDISSNTRSGSRQREVRFGRVEIESNRNRFNVKFDAILFRVVKGEVVDAVISTVNKVYSLLCDELRMTD